MSGSCNDPRFKQLRKMGHVMSQRPTKQLGLAILRKAKEVLTSKPMVQQQLL